MLCTRSNTDGNKLVIFFGIASYYGDNLIVCLIESLMVILCILSPPTPPGTRPTLPELLRFTCTDKRVVNIAEEVGTKYVQFGTFLLDDRTGSRVKNIAHKHSNDAERINTKILQEWLTRRGKQPVTWVTLVEVLHDIELSSLAGEIEAAKCLQDQSQKTY